MRTEEQQDRLDRIEALAQRTLFTLSTLLGVVIVFVVILAGFIALLFTAESATLKPIIERVVTRATGREFVLDGDFAAEIGRTITVRADEVTMANAETGSDPYMLVVEQAYVVLDLWALTRGQILIRDVQAASGKLIFEQAPDGRLNWNLGQSEARVPSGKKPLKSIPLLIENGDLKDFSITLDLPAFETPLPIYIESATQENGEEDVLDLVITGTIRDRPANVVASIGPFTTLLVGRDVSFEIDATGPISSLSGTGHIDNFIAPKRPELELIFEAIDAAQLTGVLGLREVTRGPVKLRASMMPVDTGFRAVIDGRFGEFLLDLSAELMALGTLEGLRLNVDASGPNLNVVGAVFGLVGLPEQAYTLTGRVEESGGALSIDEVVLRAGENFAKIDGILPNFPRLDAARLTADISGVNYLDFRELLRLPDASPELAAPFKFAGAVRATDDGQEIVEATAQIGEIEGRVRGTVTNPPEFLGTRLDMRASGPDISIAARLLDQPGSIHVPFDAGADLEVTESGFRFHQFRFELGENNAEISGLLGYDPLIRDSDLTASYTGNMQVLAQLAGIADLFPDVHYELAWHWRATKNGIRLEYLDATIDDDDQLKLSGMLGQIPSLDGMDLEVSANAPDLRALMSRSFPDYPLPDGPFQLAGRVRKSPTGFRLDDVIASVGENRLRMSGTIGGRGLSAGTNIEISLDGPNLAEFLPAEFTGDLDISNSPFDLSTEVNISDDQLSIKRLAFKTARGQVRGDVVLPLADLTSGGRFSLMIEGKDLDEMVPNTPRFEPASAPFEISARGEWDTERVVIQRFDATLDGSTIDLHGAIDFPPDMRASNLVLEARGPRLSSFGRLNGRPLPEKPFEITATLSGDENTAEINDLSAHVGDSSLEGVVKLDLERKPMIEVDLYSEVIDIAQFLPPVEESSDVTEADAGETTDTPINPDAPASPARDSRGNAQSRVIPDISVPVELLNSFNLQLKADAGTVILPRLSLRKLDIDSYLQDGDLVVQEMSADTEKGDFTAAMKLLTDEASTQISVTVDGRDVAFGFGEYSPEELELVPPMDFAVKLTGTGATSQELIASLNGYADLVLRPGKVKNSIATSLFGDFFSQLFERINPFATRDPYTELVCGAVFVNLANGVMTIDPGAVVQTDKMNMFAKGSVNLNTENLNISIDTAARKGIGISAGDLVNPFIRIGGTLAEPRLRMDPTSSAIEGGAAVATAGLTILARSFWGRWIATKDPCGKFTEEARKAGRELNVAY